MTRDSIDVPEGLEIVVARLETNFANLLNRYETMAEAYAPTNRQVIENGLKIAEIREDMLELRAGLRERDEKFAELGRRLEQEMLACATANGELEKRIRKEHQDREAQEENDRKVRNRWAVGIIAGGFISAFCVYLGSVLPPGMVFLL